MGARSSWPQDRKKNFLRSLKRLKANNCDAIFIKTDVCIEEECKRLIEKTIETYGTIDILINNAGLSMRASFIDVDTKVLHRLMDVNFWGTVYCTKYALPYLIEQ